MSAGAFEEAFRRNRIELVNRIDLTDASPLLLCLQSKGVLTKFQFDEIKSSPTNLMRATKMMDILERRDDALYPLFIDALAECGQDPVVLLLHQAPSRNPIGAAAEPTSRGAMAQDISGTGAVAQNSTVRMISSTSRTSHDFPLAVNVEPYSSLSNVTDIAEGGFGIIYHATHAVYGEVAYKELKITIMKIGDKASRELLREAQAQILRHDNIICVLAVIYEPKHYGVVLEYAEHGALDEFISFYEDEIGYPAKLQLAMDVILGMNYIHTLKELVIHGDLKVQNVLVGSGCIAKICDFGLSKWKQFSTTKTGSRTQRGTVTNIPPENWHNINLRRSVKYDMYGFGILLWEVMSGKQAFEQAGANMDLIKSSVMTGQRPDMDDIEGAAPFVKLVDDLKDLIQICWHQNPDERPTFAVIKDSFETLLNEHKDAVKDAMASLRLRVLQAPAHSH